MTYREEIEIFGQTGILIWRNWQECTLSGLLETFEINRLHKLFNIVMMEYQIPNSSTKGEPTKTFQTCANEVAKALIRKPIACCYCSMYIKPFSKPSTTLKI